MTPGSGIEIGETSGTDVGDSVSPPAASANRNRGNVIGGAAIGVDLRTDAEATRVVGNYIGVSRTGAVTSVGLGVKTNGANGNTIGPFNTIARATGVGVELNVGQGNRVVANEIRDNGGKGIVLNEGADESLPAPILAATAVKVGATTTINGTISGGPADRAFFVEFFTNAACDSSGSERGRTFIFSVGATTNSDGNATFTFNSTAPVAGEIVTATATSTTTASTSEFSNCATVVAEGGGSADVTTSVAVAPASILAGGLAQATITVRNTSAAALQVSSLTATLPPGFSLVRNSTTVGGVSTTEPTASEPAALGGTLTWPRSGAPIAPPQWPIQLAAETEKTLVFELSAPASPVGPAALTVSGTSPGHTVVGSSTDVSAVAVVANRLVIPASEDTWVDQANPAGDPRRRDDLRRPGRQRHAEQSAARAAEVRPERDPGGLDRHRREAAARDGRRLQLRRRHPPPRARDPGHVGRGDDVGDEAGRRDRHGELRVRGDRLRRRLRS